MNRYNLMLKEGDMHQLYNWMHELPKDEIKKAISGDTYYEHRADIWGNNPGSKATDEKVKPASRSNKFGNGL